MNWLPIQNWPLMGIVKNLQLWAKTNVCYKKRFYFIGNRTADMQSLGSRGILSLRVLGYLYASAARPNFFSWFFSHAFKVTFNDHGWPTNFERPRLDQQEMHFFLLAAAKVRPTPRPTPGTSRDSPKRRKKWLQSSLSCKIILSQGRPTTMMKHD